MDPVDPSLLRERAVMVSRILPMIMRMGYSEASFDDAIKHADEIAKKIQNQVYGTP